MQMQMRCTDAIADSEIAQHMQISDATIAEIYSKTSGLNLSLSKHAVFADCIQNAFSSAISKRSNAFCIIR